MMRAAANQTDPRLSVIVYYNLPHLAIDFRFSLSSTRCAHGAWIKVSLLALCSVSWVSVKVVY